MSFVIVYGGPRTGTSLTCDLVEVCGYNFGQTPERPDLRRGRKEHRITSFPYNEDRHQDVRASITKEGVNAAKVIGFPSWIDFLISDGYNVKVLATQRNVKARNASANSMLLHLSQQNKVPIQERDIQKRDMWLEAHPDVPRLDVHFEQLIARDISHLQEIRDFIDGDCNVSDMLSVIKPQVVMYV